VITGFNTDIEFDGKIYHVQTEDKGPAKPLIVTLIYDRGTIIASKRTPYDDLINGSVDEPALTERLQKQHRTICAAIRAGRVEDLKRLSAKDADAKATKTTAESFELKSSLPSQKTNLPNLNAVWPAENYDLAVPIPLPVEKPIEPIEIETTDAVEVVPDDAIKIVSELVGKSRPVNNRLTIELPGDSDFRGGQHRTVTFIVCRGSERKVVPDAQIMVKIFGSTFRPLIFHARTDRNGIARINLQFPVFTEGRAALLARAISDGDEAELRRLVAHG